MNAAGVILIILMGAFTGWAVTWMSMKILFYPIKPTRFLGLNFQGIFPKNHQLIAEKLGQIVSTEFLSFSKIEEKISSPDNLEKLRPEIEKHIDYFLRTKLNTVFPMISTLMGEKTILQFKEAFIAELELLFPVLMKNYLGKLQHDLNIEKLVTEKVAGFSAQKLAQLVNEKTKTTFKRYQLAGIIFGSVVGIIQVMIAYFTKT